MKNIKYSIGIDMSKRDFKACFVVINDTQDLKVKASRAFTNTITGWEQFKEWYNKHQSERLPTIFVVEATGSYHEQLSWFIYNDKQDLSIVLPNRAKAYTVSLGVKSKNDKVDAQALAKMGAVQKLAIWKPISEKIYSLRALTRHLEDLQNIRTSLLNQNEQCEHALYAVKLVSTSLSKTIKTIDKQIADCKKQIHKIIEKDAALSRKVAFMTSIKGVSTITAAVVVGETNGFALITNSKQLTSYAGYDVKENQSGSKVGKTRITKKGNAHIRRAMHLPAFNTVRLHVKNFENLYIRVYEKSGIKMKAYVAVQSKLLKLMYSLWKNETYFDADYKTSGFQETKPLASC
jgi:transposase